MNEHDEMMRVARGAALAERNRRVGGGLRWPVNGVSVLVWVDMGTYVHLLKVHDFWGMKDAQDFIDSENSKGDRRVELNFNDGSAPMKIRPTKMLVPEHRLSS